MTDLNRLMTPRQFAKWRGVSEAWVRANRDNPRTLPGVIFDSRKNWVIHPATYIAERTKRR